MGIAPELEDEIERLEGVVGSRTQELRRLRDAIAPFVLAADVIEKRPQDYGNRIVAVGGLGNAYDLTKEHFARLLKAHRN
jgi:hypothetical protein